MAYKPPKLQTDDRGRNYVTKTIRGQRFTKYLGKAGTPEARVAHDEFLEQYKSGTVDWSKSKSCKTPPLPVDPTPRLDPGQTAGPQVPVAEAVELYWGVEKLRDISQGEHQVTRDVLDTVMELWGAQPVAAIDTARLHDLRVHFRTTRNWGYKKIKDGERRVLRFVDFCVVKKLAPEDTAFNLSRMPTFQPGELGTRPKESRRPVKPGASTDTPGGSPSAATASGPSGQFCLRFSTITA